MPKIIYNGVAFNTDIMEKDGVKINEHYDLQSQQINSCRVIMLKEIDGETFVAYENIDRNICDIVSIDEFNKMRSGETSSDEFDLDKELGKVNPVRALTSGKITKDYIGRMVRLTNSEVDTEEWIIANVNHDSTEGTVDLFPAKVLKTDMQFDTTSQLYSLSDLRYWLNDEFYNGFTEEIRNAIVDQQILSNGEILEDKVKCPSLTELGISYDYLINEGSMYPIFGDEIKYGVNISSIFKDKNGNSMRYWTRSRRTNYSYYVWFVNNNGYCLYNNCNYSGAVVACIRFKKS